MRVVPRLLLSALCILLLATTAYGGTTSSWPHLRGPNYDGRADHPEAFDTEGFGLEVAWKVPVGPAYSGIAVSDGLVITFFSDGTDDVAAAFDSATGEERWRYRIDSTYRGHDGSTDGPLSSPVVVEGMVHGLGAHGQLFTLDLATGKEVWVIDLQETFGSQEPDFGFTTTPLVAGDHLIVQAGGKAEASLVGLDRKTGERRWGLGDQRVQYQSPAVLELAGRRQVVAAAGNSIDGIDPATGALLWRHEVADDDRAGSASPMAIGDDRFLVLAGGGALAYTLVADGDGYRLEEAFRSQGLGRNYALPVFHDGYLYGFRGNILTCVRATDGEIVWRSRPPGGRGLILVEGHLVVLGAGGEVVVAEATPEGFDPKAEVKALDGTGYTWPSFASGQIFVRNLESMAAVRVSEPRAAAEERQSDHALTALLRQVRGAENRQAKLEELLGEIESFPWIDGNRVHLLYRGEAQDVAVVSAMAGAASSVGMEHLEGTDLFYETFEVAPGTRWEYHFLVDLETEMADPLNPHLVPPGRGDHQLSELRMPGYRETSYAAEPKGGPRGTVQDLSFTDKAGIERKLRAYLPPGYEAEGDRSYPLLLVQGTDWLDKGLMHHSLENLLGEKVDPVVMVFLADRDRWWLEAGGSETEAYAEMLAEELVPFLESELRLRRSAEERAVMGTEGYGLSALYTVLAHPEVFSRASVGSVHLGAGSGDALMELIAGPRREGVEIYLDWNRFDVRRTDTGHDLAGDSRKLHEMLQKRGYSVAGGEVVDSHGWGADRAHSGRVLMALFPAQGE